MMRRFCCYITALLGLMACSSLLEEKGSPAMDPALEGKPVTVTFSLPDVRILSPETKGLDADGDIYKEPYLDPDRLFLVVCGQTQSVKYIRKATLVGSEVVDIDDIDDYPLDDALGVQSVTLYTFSVQLELSDQPRTIHFLGNVDESQLITGLYSYQVLPTLLSHERKQAYWQKVYVENIHPQLDAHEHPIMNDDGGYLPNDYIKNRLKNVPLIRNYAKIQVTDRTDKENTAPEDQFELYSYAVIFYPKRGSAVPYRYNAGENEDPFSFNASEGSRLSGYERCKFDTLEDIGYQGHLPSGVTFDEDIPTADQFEHPDGVTVIRYDENYPDRGFYVYERSIPTTAMGPTYVIIRGRFGNEGDYYYYRLDLMETTQVNNESVAQYYPIYRNFRYNIEINRISSQGLSSPEAAANSSGAIDISADISMRHLSDISNGQTRLLVEPFMSRTYTGPSEDGYYYLYARFFNNLNSDEPNKEWGAVTVELEPMEDQSADILILYDDQGHEIHGGGFFYPVAQEMGGFPGFRIIRFNTKMPGETTQTQKIKITGRNRGVYEEFPLYREVEISLQSKQNMTVTCSKSNLPGQPGAQQVVNITIPSGLPSSMFPLDFVIEAEDMTLTPDNKVDDNNLPVHTGLSISDNAGYAGKTTFQFIRTLSLNEYRSNSTEGFCTFSSYFKSNRAESATTIWVYNEYFHKKSVSFTNQGVIIEEPGGHFYVEADGQRCYVKFNTNNLECKLTGEDWKSYDKSVITLESEERVYFRSGSITDYSGSVFKCSSKSDMSDTKGKFRVGGNLASLLVADNFETEGASYNKTYKFTNFFKGHTGLSDASALVMPMLSCPANAYKSMFEGCTGLVNVPQGLPATTLATSCYESMFNGCTSITGIPNGFLPATNLATSCYKTMFYGCNKLTTVPAGLLPATVVEEQAYYQMFRGCSALTTPPSTLPGSTLKKACYYQMFYQCSALTSVPDFPHDSDATYVLAAGTDKNSLCYQMFYGCNGLTTLEGKKLFNSSTPLQAYCFQDMFSTCTKLETVPADFLPATTLAESCYRGMFQQTAITRAPDLLAPTLVSNCYRYMFNACKSLSYIKCYSTSKGSTTYTQNWLQNAKNDSDAEFHYRAGVTWDRDNHGIPSKWTPVAETVQ